MAKTATAKQRIVKKKNNNVKSPDPYVILAPGVHLGFYNGDSLLHFNEQLNFEGKEKKLLPKKQEEIEDQFDYFCSDVVLGFENDSLPFCCGIIELGDFSFSDYIDDLVNPKHCAHAAFNRRNITRAMAQLLEDTVKNFNRRTIIINIIPAAFSGGKLKEDLEYQLLKEAIIKTGLFKLVRSGQLATANVVETWILKDR